MNNEPDLMPEGIDPVINGSDFAEQKLNHRNAKPRPSPPTDPQHEASVNPKVQTQAELRTDPQFIADANRWYNAAYDAEQAIRSRQNSDIISQTPDGKAHEAPERLLSESEIVDWAIEGASRFNWNLTGALIDYNVMRKRPVGDVRAMMGVIDRYSASENTMDTTGRALKYLATDPLTYIGVGLVAKGVVHGGTSAAGKGYLRNLLGKAVTNPAVIGAVEGGVYTGAFASAEEDLQAKAQERDFNATIPMISTGIGVGLGAALGAAAPAIKWGWPKMVKLFRGGEKAGNSFTDSPAAAATHGPVAEHEVEVRSPAILPEVTTLDEVADHFNLDEAQTERLAAAVSDADAVDNLFERQLEALNDRLDATNAGANKALDSAQLPDAAALPEVSTPGATPLPQASLPNAPTVPEPSALPDSGATPAAELPSMGAGADPSLPTPTLPTGGVSRTPIETSKLMKVEGVQEVLKDAGADMVVYPEKSPQIQQRLNAPKNEIGMFSQVEVNVIDANVPGWKDGGAVNGQELWNKIKNSGVKQEELEWLDIEGLLTKDPKGKFTKAEVLEHIDNHRVKVEESVGANDQEFVDSENWMSEANREVDDDPANWEHITEEAVYSFDIEDTDDWIVSQFIESVELDLPNGVRRSDMELMSAEQKSAHVFSNMADEFREFAEAAAEEQYLQDPYLIIELDTGGSNPDLFIVGNDDIGWDIREGNTHWESSLWSQSRGGAARDSRPEIYSEAEAIIQAENYARESGYDMPYGSEGVRYEDYVTDGPYENYREVKLTLPDNPDSYDSPHFDEENIVSHMMVTDRNLMLDGKEVKTYFIDETQSDWHSDGRKKGYRTPEHDAQLADLRSKRDNASQSYKDKIRETLPDDLESEGNHFKLIPDEPLVHIDTMGDVANMATSDISMTSREESIYKAMKDYFSPEDIEEISKLTWERKDAQKAYNGTGDPVADAPFKKDAWLALTMKRALIDAAEQGYEAIAWADGTVLKNKWNIDHGTQYDKKMPSLMKRLMGEKAEHLPFVADHFNLVEVRSPAILDADAPLNEGEAGYWIVPVKPEVKSKVTGEGLPLFSMSSLIAGVTASMAAPYEAEAASEESSLDPDGTSMTYRVLDKSLLDQEKLGAE